MRPNVSRDVSIFFAGVAIFIGGEAVFEGITGINIWEKIFAPMDDLVKQGRGLRFGLSRASGPTRYSIFLGIVLMLLTPWCISLIGRHDRKWVRVFGVIALLSCIAGIVATVSRGPLLGMVLAGAVSITIVWPWTFKWFAGTAMVGLLLVVTFWEQVISLVESTQTTNQVRVQVVEVDGEYEAFSGSRNRLLVWEIYGPLVLKGGPLGYGTEAVSSFPPNIPGLPTSAKARATLGIVDNSYLLIGLRFGWIGIGLFLALLGGSIVTAIQLRRSAGLILYPDGPAFLTAMASILVGVAFEIMTVFSSYDFMFWILFHCGIVAGLASLRRDMVRGLAV